MSLSRVSGGSARIIAIDFAHSRTGRLIGATMPRSARVCEQGRDELALRFPGRSTLYPREQVSIVRAPDATYRRGGRLRDVPHQFSIFGGVGVFFSASPATAPVAL
eukprot:30667-Pelagococcus_subviridis.AAC.2